MTMLQDMQRAARELELEAGGMERDLDAADLDARQRAAARQAVVVPRRKAAEKVLAAIAAIEAIPAIGFSPAPGSRDNQGDNGPENG